MRSSNDGKNYFREVVLETLEGSKPTEYGAIEIILETLPEEARELVVQARLPLVGFSMITNTYSSSPAFLKVVPDEPIVKLLVPWRPMKSLAEAMKSLDSTEKS